MEVNKIALVLDTCILEKTEKEKEDLSVFNMDVYDDAVDLIERNELQDQISVFVPRIVILELSRHKENKLKSRIENAKKLVFDIGNVSGINLSFDFEYKFKSKKHINDIADKKIKNINIIEIPEDRSFLFQEILNMSICKNPPFKSGDSDNGFKDSIILKSIENFAKVNDFNKFVLFTKDKGFSKPLIETFKEVTGKELKIISNKDVQGYISNLFSLFPEFKKYLNSEFLPKVEEQIKKLTTIAIPSDGVFEISEAEINDFELEQMNEEEYNINISLKIKYKNNQGEIREIEDVIKPYSFKKKDNEGWGVEEGRCNYYIY